MGKGKLNGLAQSDFLPVVAGNLCDEVVFVGMT
jgi:hypothetical protein